MTSDERFIQRCFDLALKGAGSVSPNPLVGSVITLDDKIIGEGWHQQYGGPHGEVNAIASVQDQSLLARATVYVNLEPCAHFGKTPPCADMLVRHRVKRVVISNTDPFERVNGMGIEKLRAAGIEVVTGVLEKEGLRLNRRFFTSVTKQRPYIILKWAQSSDGYVGTLGKTISISSDSSRQLVHRWRTEEDAFLVGRATAANDNPQLNSRLWAGRNPVRVVLDRFLKLNSNLHLFDGSQRTICYNSVKDSDSTNLQFVKLPPEDFILNVINDLHQKKIQSIVVEGGTETLNLFINNGLWDEARVFTSPHSLGGGVKAPTVDMKNAVVTEIGDDQLSVVQNLSTNPLPVK